ncbi:MAG: DNA (cytosine-5-)-methyltransferase, partial [Caldisericum exile]
MFKIGSLFSGIGGIELGFAQASELFHTVWAIEKDHNACDVLYNFPEICLYENDVNNVAPELLEDIDILTAGFPCQAFSVAGYRKGFDDPRGNVFFRILDFIDVKKPSVLFLENVKNLRGHDKGRTFKIIKSELEKRNYTVYAKVLNTLEYGGLPQNRERIYIIGFSDRNTALKFSFPEKIP